MNIGNVLDRISDENWHDLDEISSATRIDKEELVKIVGFFREYGFIEVNASGEKVKIDKDYLVINA